MARQLMPLLLAALVAALASQATAAPRGVDPQHAAAYVPRADGTFKCLDGSRVIPYSRVNDDYCDCLTDGSDEPGTSACYHGKFYCANRGHTPQSLASAFVNDGICDCCDGADEPAGHCRNSCLDKGAAERQVVREGVERMRRSLDLKQQLVQQGVQRRQGWGARKGALVHELEAQQKEIVRLEEEKKQKEAAAEADRQRIRAEQEEAEKQRQADAAAAEAAAQAAQAAQQQAEGADPAGSGAEGGAEQAQETDEERGRRIASQWTSDPDAAAVPAQDDEAPEVEDHHVDHNQEYHHYDGGEEHDAHHDDAPQTHHHQPYVYTPLDSEVHTVSSQLDGARRRLTELQDEQRVIERYHSSGVQYDYGPGDAFASLAGRCLSDTGARWTYEACFFDKATQNEPHNPSNRVSLGTWSHWSSNYTQAVFANGDACSGGVTRSLTVKLVCEESERMWGGEEPSMCTYTVWFATPLACQHQDLQQELDKLAALEKFEAEIRAEIEAAEKATGVAGAVDTHTEL